MALLKFNKGEVANLSNQAVSEGNVYITTDSQEMFVDVSGNKRIKISDFVTVATAAELDTVTVYENAFYYIADTKTIVRYGGIGEDNKKIWEGINKTDEIEVLDGRLDTAENNISTLNTANINTNTRIDNLNAVDIATTDEIVVTTAVGNYSVGEPISANTSLQDLILNMLCADSAPTVTDSSLSISGTAKYFEIESGGSTSITATYDKGGYQYGYALLDNGEVDVAQTEDDGKEKAKKTFNDTTYNATTKKYSGTTGADLTYLEIKYDNNVVQKQSTGNTLTATVNSGKKSTRTSAKVYANCKHNAGYIPVSILKNKYKSKGIAAAGDSNPKSANTTSFYWYIPMFKGFKYGDNLIADPKNITADEVLGLTKITDSTAYNETKPTSETATASWTQFFVAIPEQFVGNKKSYTLIKSGSTAGISDSNKLPLTVEQSNNVKIKFGDKTEIEYRVFYVNLDAPYDTKNITLTWVEG